MSNKPMHIKPSGKKKSAEEGCAGCGRSVKRTDPRIRKNARRTIKKRY